MAGTRKISEKKIKTTLEKQLEARGFTKDEHAYLYDCVRDYMSMYRVKEQLIADIDERGVNIVQPSGVMKRNDSVNDLVKVNAQMSKLLGFMGLKPPEMLVEENDIPVL